MRRQRVNQLVLLEPAGQLPSNQDAPLQDLAGDAMPVHRSLDDTTAMHHELESGVGPAYRMCRHGRTKYSRIPAFYVPALQDRVNRAGTEPLLSLPRSDVK